VAKRDNGDAVSTGQDPHNHMNQITTAIAVVQELTIANGQKTALELRPNKI